MDVVKGSKCHFGQSLYTAETFQLQLIYGICILIIDLNGR